MSWCLLFEYLEVGIPVTVTGCEKQHIQGGYGNYSPLQLSVISWVQLHSFFFLWQTISAMCNIALYFSVYCQKISLAKHCTQTLFDEIRILKMNFKILVQQISFLSK